MKRTQLALASLLLFSALALRPQPQDVAYAIQGTLVTSTGIVENGTMVVGNGRIQAIGRGLTLPDGVPPIKADGIVLPGFVDLHNHLAWNVLPRWSLPAPAANRYEWQAMPEYAARLSKPEGELIAAGEGCDMERYAEVKALLGGATSVTGSYGPTPAQPHRNDCVRGLARNLDSFSGLYSDQTNLEPLRYEIFPLEIGWEQAQTIREGLASGSIKAAIFHIAEGKDASARREFRMLKARGLLLPGVSIVHGTALGKEEFGEMAANGVGLIWSPRSNLELYGKTTDIEAAKAANVTIALAPDWSPTGSSGMLEELRVAVRWNRTHGRVLSDSDLFQMVTANPARLAGAGDRIGALSAGMMADFIVLRSKAGSPMEALVEDSPKDLKLVVVGGKPMLGDADSLGRFKGVENPESVTVCGQHKLLNIREEVGGQSWKAIVDRLTAALQTAGVSLAGLRECATE